jgi:hypothetical protein
MMSLQAEREKNDELTGRREKNDELTRLKVNE